MLHEKQQYKNIPQEIPNTPITKLHISVNGDIDFSGHMTEETQELIEIALQQAEIAKSRAANLESEKQKRLTEIDGITVVFLSCVLAMILFLTYTTVSGIASMFKPQSNNNQQESINV